MIQTPLKKIKNIISLERIRPEESIRSTIGENKYQYSLENSKHINVYKIIYKSQGHLVIGFIAEPKKGKHLPVVIWNRGGNREFGMINTNFIFSNSFGRLARAGYFVIGSQYSGNDGGEGIDNHGGGELADIISLLPIIKQYSKADENRIGMWGGSRGGMMAFLALKKVKWIKAVVCLAPISNLRNQIKNRPVMEKVYRELFRFNKRTLSERSVIDWVDKLPKKSPILLIHGTADWRVNVQDTLDLGKRLYQEKIPYRMLIYEGADHSLSEYYPEMMDQAIAWFNRYVKKGESLPNLNPHGD